MDRCVEDSIRMIRSGSFRVFAACALVALCGVIASAQYTNATISGIVYDPGGAVVTGASVTIRNPETGYSKTVQTGAEGGFLFPGTPLGSYEIVVEKPGFSRYVQSGITLAVNQVANVPVTLKVG